MQELDSSQNDTEFQLKSPNWAGWHSIIPVAIIERSGISHSRINWFSIVRPEVATSKMVVG
eukprot:COSAG02_NODE_1025_length_15146_cov_21.959460_1_plen_61_part_00